jgi:hypothetical protein
VGGGPVGGILQGLGDQEVGGGLHGSRVASLGHGVEFHREGSRVSQAGQGSRKARLGQDRRVDPVGQLPEFIQGRLRLTGRLGEQRPGGRVAVGLGTGAGEPQVVGEGQQALLGAVMQVALQPPAFGVAGLDDADAGGAQLVELSERLGLQPFVL